MLSSLFQDLRYGIRLLTKNPGVTSVAVITLGLGVGANTAIFSGVNAFLLRELPVPNARQLTRPAEITDDRGLTDEFSYSDYLEYRSQATSFTGIAGEDMIQVALNAQGQTDVVWGQVVTGNYFSVLQVTPAQGRAFAFEEDKTLGTHPVVVISPNLGPGA